MACTGCNDCNCEEAEVLTSKTEQQLKDKLRIFHDLVCVVMNANCIDLPRIMGKFIYMLWCFLRDIVNQIIELKNRVDKLGNNDEICEKISHVAEVLNHNLTVEETNKARLTEYNASLASYQAQLTDYNKQYQLYQDKRKQIANAKTEYDRAYKAYTEALARWNSNQGNYTRDKETYDRELAKWQKEQDDYAKALAKYQADLTAYNNAVANNSNAMAEYERLYAEYQRKLQEFERQAVGRIRFSLNFVQIENTIDPSEYDFDNQGNFEIRTPVKVTETQQLGYHFIRGRVNMNSRYNADSGETTTAISSVTVSNAGYVNTSGTRAFSNFSMTYSTPDGQTLWTKTHNGEATNDTINRSYNLSGNLTLGQGQSRDVEILRFRDMWVSGSAGKVMLRVVNENTSRGNPPTPPTRPNTTSVTRPTEPTRPTTPKPTEPSAPTSEKPKEPAKPNLEAPTEPTKPKEPEQPKLESYRQATVFCKGEGETR